MEAYLRFCIIPSDHILSGDTILPSYSAIIAVLRVVGLVPAQQGRLTTLVERQGQPEIKIVKIRQ